MAQLYWLNEFAYLDEKSASVTMALVFERQNPATDARVNQMQKQSTDEMHSMHNE